MSTKNGDPPAPNPAHNSNFSLLLVLGRERLTGPNYMDWMRNLRFTLRYKNKDYVLDEQIPIIDDDLTQEEIEAHQKHYDDANKVSCIIGSSMSPELQKTFENTWAYEMNQQLKEMFQAKASKERLDVVKSLMACKPKLGASIYAFVLEMKGYFDRLESLNMVFDVEISINIILSGLPADYNQFVLSYQMNRKETSIMKLHRLLQTAEQGIKKIDMPSTSMAPVLTVGHNVKKRKTSQSNWKGKAAIGMFDRGSKRMVEYEIAPMSDPKEVESMRLKHGELNLVMENRKITLVTRIGKYELMLKSRVRIDLNNYVEGKRPSLGHIKIWGCEVFVRREAQDKLEARSEKCLFVSYPEESFGYLFYIPKDNVVFIARRGVFLEREMVSKEDSRSKIDLEEIQESVDEEHIVNTNTQQEVVTHVKPNDISLSIHRTTGRVSKPPQFYYGFYIEEDKISDSTLSKLDEPANYKEAMASPKVAKWKESMKSEIQSMYDNQVWNLVDTTPGFKMVGCKWIFKKKTDMDGKVHTYKARLVAKGYTQTHGIDYDETLSPTAFVNEKLTEDVFMAQPEGFENAEYPKRVCKLQKSIYGLKQASRSWNICFHEKVTQFGFPRRNDIPTLQSVKDWLGKCFAMKDLEDAAYILGIKIYRDRSKRLIGLSQDTYLDKILKRFKMENSKKENLPIHYGTNISKDLCSKTDIELDKMSRVPYASAVGSIMYAMACTRPGVSFALSMVSRHQQNPGKGHWTDVKNILKYLRNTKDWFLVYGGEEELRVIGYCDESWKTNKDDSRSQSGWVFLLNGGAVTWKVQSKIQWQTLHASQSILQVMRLQRKLSR
ncbi:putative RNA-directed DNA polymerase [Tanacetum coccineum]